MISIKVKRKIAKLNKIFDEIQKKLDNKDYTDINPTLYAETPDKKVKSCKNGFRQEEIALEDGNSNDCNNACNNDFRPSGYNSAHNNDYINCYSSGYNNACNNEYNVDQKALPTKDMELIRKDKTIETQKQTIYNLCHQINNLKNDILEVIEENHGLKRTLKEFISKNTSQLKTMTTRLRKSDQIISQLSDQIIDLKGTIRVFCRIKKEPLILNEGINRAVIGERNMEIEMNSKKMNFMFDRVFDVGCQQNDVFNELNPLIQSAMNGYNVCVLAYGQTGSGKTYTMTGDIGPVSNKSDGNDLKNIFQANGIGNNLNESVNVDMINGVDNSNIGIHNSPSSNEGIIPRSLRLIFSQSNERTRISVQFFEIYNESVRNLVTGENSDIKIYKDDVVFSNLEPIDISGIEDVELLLQEIDKKRSVAATRCNPKSSRGHTFFAIQVVRMESCDGSATGSRDILKAAGSLVFVDLAGSERLKASQSADQRLEETKKINSSLLALRKVISALYRKEKHVPYRDSKLTLVLKKYFTARSRIVMITNVSLSENNFDETICSLRFSQIAGECSLGEVKKNFSRVIRE